MRILTRVIGTLLIMVGVIGLIFSTMAFGDIDVAIMIAAIIGILAGIGFWVIPINKS
jgi:hypothetical protein